ncbi:MAG: hypothetical protein U1E65_04655 [Myxococcota bacterium]
MAGKEDDHLVSWDDGGATKVDLIAETSVFEEDEASGEALIVGPLTDNAEVLGYATTNALGASQQLLYVNPETARRVAPNAIPHRLGPPTAAMTPYERFVLEAIDGSKAVADIQKEGLLSRPEVSAVLLSLLERKLIRLEIKPINLDELPEIEDEDEIPEAEAEELGSADVEPMEDEDLGESTMEQRRSPSFDDAPIADDLVLEPPRLMPPAPAEEPSSSGLRWVKPSMAPGQGGPSSSPALPAIAAAPPAAASEPRRPSLPVLPPPPPPAPRAAPPAPALPVAPSLPLAPRAASSTSLPPLAPPRAPSMIPPAVTASQGLPAPQPPPPAISPLPAPSPILPPPAAGPSRIPPPASTSSASLRPPPPAVTESRIAPPPGPDFRIAPPPPSDTRSAPTRSSSVVAAPEPVTKLDASFLTEIEPPAPAAAAPAPKTPPPPAQTPPPGTIPARTAPPRSTSLSTVARARALYETALADREGLDLVAARMNLKLAIAFDPSNQIYQRLFMDLADEGAGKHLPRLKEAKAQKAFDEGCEAELKADIDGALKFFETSLKLSNDPIVMNRMAVLLATRKKYYSRAEELLMKAVAAAPHSEIYKSNLLKIQERAAAEPPPPEKEAKKKKKKDGSAKGKDKKAPERRTSFFGGMFKSNKD